MSTAAGPIPENVSTILREASEFLSAGKGFDRVQQEGGEVVAHAEGAPDEADYRLVYEDGGFFVEWVSKDRYLSQSIESVLVFTGDDLWDMIDEELVDLGWSRDEKLGELQHYRNDALEFVFRVRVPGSPGEVSVEELGHVVMAFDAAMCDLGDMADDDEEG